RIVHITKTWFNLARKQTYIFTDGDDDELNRTTDGHLINTHCGAGNGREHLGCKMGTEYEAYLASGKKWWCRFDDDNYVNPPRLLELIKRFNWTKDVYIGKLSVPGFSTSYHGKQYNYRFAHGGAGCCISRPLAWKMKPWCGREAIVKTQMEASMNDDCALGFIITALLGVDITLTDLFHSHHENLAVLDPNTFPKQVSLCWSNDNKVDLKNLKTKSKVFDIKEDPSRFYSVHCLAYPKTDFCK
uniref:Fringe-like glycosyltransferase domain-containing protein n=1 Tax=Ciona savignyi TaxID=51511 RepID=H2Z083_CIOSA